MFIKDYADLRLSGRADDGSFSNFFPLYLCDSTLNYYRRS